MIFVFTAAMPVFAQSQNTESAGGSAESPIANLPGEVPQGAAEEGGESDKSDEIAPAEAKGIFGENFDDTLETLSADPIVPEQPIERYTSDYTGTVLADDGAGTDDDAPSALVESSLPLRVPDGEGHKVPIDLTLERTSAGYVPTSPLVPVSIPDSATSRVGLVNDGVSIGFPNAEGNDAAKLFGEGLLYANAEPDTDLVVAPLQTGVEVFWQLRSPVAPEEFRLDLGLEDGASLRAAGGGAEVVRDGDVIGFVRAPTTVDANGVDVPTALAVDGNDLVVTLSHRATEGLAYPLLVDPAYESYDWKIGSSVGLSDWAPLNTPTSSRYDLRTTCNTSWYCYGSPSLDRGLYIYAPKGGTPYTASSSGSWTYQVSRGTTYITDARFYNVQHNRRGSQLNNPRLRVALADAQTGQIVDSQTAIDASGSLMSVAQPSGAATPEQVRFETYVPQNANDVTLDERRDTYVGQAFVQLQDSEDPTLSVTTSGLPPEINTPNSGATSYFDRIQGTFNVTASDPSLGVQSIHYSPNGPNQVHTPTPTCTGAKSSQCPVNFSKTFSYDSNQQAEGPGVIRIKTYDASDRYSPTKEYYVRIDRSPPLLSVTGALRQSPATGNQLTIEAKDTLGGWSTPAGLASGVQKVEIFVDGSLVKTEANPYPATDYNRIYWAPSFTWNGDSSENSKMEVVATDWLGHVTRDKWTVRPGTDPGADDPLVERVVGDQIDKWVNTTGTQTVSVFGRDRRSDQSGTGGDRGISELSIKVPGNTKSAKTIPCGGADGCSSYAGADLTYSTADLADGVSHGGARAKAPDGQVSKLKNFDLKIDRQPPVVTNFSSNAVLAPGTSNVIRYDIKVDATDGVASPTTDDQRRAGVGSIEVYVRGERRFGERFRCPQGNCPASSAFHYTPSAEDLITSQGLPILADIKAVVRDGAGNVIEADNPTTGFEPVATGLGSIGQAMHRGLENYFQYDSVETGVSGGHTNLGTGNFTFHKVPIVNPGRGLSTVVNMTYNSDDHALSELVDPAPLFTNLSSQTQTDVQSAKDSLGSLLSNELSSRGIGYNEVGSGFSAGISGLTRVNEPLGGVFTAQLGSITALTNPGSITLTDPDGTAHVFTAKPDELDAFEAPPGVDLRLRHYSATYMERYNGDTSNTGPLNQTLPQNWAKFWAMTRPDGVTYFFDALGYARSIEDRNGNQIKFIYSLVNPLTGLSCEVNPTVAVAIKPGICEPRLTSVVDPAGNDAGASQALKAERTLTVQYYDLPSVGSALDPIALGSAGKIKSITDHGGRRLDLTYDAGGRLKTMTEAAGTSAARTTSFDYQGPSVLLGHQQMTKITDPRGHATNVDYYSALSPLTDPNGTLANKLSHLTVQDLPVPGIEDIPDRHVKTVTDRNNQTRTYKYESSTGDGGPLDSVLGSNAASVTDARGTERRYTFDSRQRVQEILEVTKPANGSNAEENRVTALDWSQDNRVTRMTEGATRQGSALDTTGAATTLYSYNDNGALTSTTDPLGRTSYLAYANTAGILRADKIGGAPSIDSDADGFVSDLWLVLRPKDNGLMLNYETTKNGAPVVATDGTAALNGNVIAQTDSTGAQSKTSYDAKGQVATTTNQVGDVTEYEGYDPSGLPTSIVAPRGTNASSTDGGRADNRWLYRYDNVGNLLQSIDPRGVGSLTSIPANQPAGAPFTTTLTYDDLDRVVDQNIPKCSSAGCGATDRIERHTVYDLNGNVTSRTDGTGATVESDFSNMDRPLEVRNPASDASGQTRIEKTKFSYDPENGLVGVEQPRGVATSGVADDFTTNFKLDALGRKVAQIRRFGSNASRDLITSFAYDRRDNVVGVALPRDNATRSVDGQGAITYDTIPVDSAISRAADPAYQRVATTYDLADERIRQVEDPGNPGSTQPLALRTEWSYDANGNMVREVDPRGFAPGADPGAFSTIYDYDVRDLPTVVTDPMGCRTTTTYDAAGRVKSVEKPNGATTSVSGDYTVNYTYDANGDVQTRSIPLAVGQYGKTQPSELDDLYVEYTRDAVGNPVTIKDARGNSFQNWFFDSGEIAKTERPSWWSADWGSPSTAPDPARRFRSRPAGIPADIQVPVGGPQLSEASGAAQDSMEIGPGQSAPGSGASDFGDVDAEAMPSFIPRAGVARFDYDDEMRLRFVTDSRDVQRELRYDPSGRLTQKRLPYNGTAQIVHDFAYDQDGNLISSADGEGKTTSFAYDPFDRLQSETAPGSFSYNGDTSADAEVTTYQYDPNGNLERRLMPRSISGSRLAFQFAFDPVDRLRQEVNPANEDFEYTYNEAGSLKTETSPRDYLTQFGYDNAERLTALTEAVGTGVERTSRFAYDADGNQTLSIAPGADVAPNASHPSGYRDRTTCQAYDGSDRLWKSTVGVAGAMDDSMRTTITEYDANGDLRRVVNPKGVSGSCADASPVVVDSDPQVSSGVAAGQTLAANAAKNATVGVYDADGLLRDRFLPWGDNTPSISGATDPSGASNQLSENQKRYVQEFEYIGPGWLRSISEPHGLNDTGFYETSYTHYDSGWFSGSTEPNVNIPGDSGPIGGKVVSYEYDKRGNQTVWQTVGFDRPDPTPGTTPSDDPIPSERRVERTFYPSGLLEKRAGLVKRSTTSPTEERSYRYFYNEDRSLQGVLDKLPKEVIYQVQGGGSCSQPADNSYTCCPGYGGSPNNYTCREIIVSRDPAERETLVDEHWNGGKDTATSYDKDGNVLTRKVDGQYSGGAYNGGRQTDFEYDALSRETKMTVDDDRSSSSNATRVWNTSYFPSDEIKQLTKPNGTTEKYYFRADGLIESIARQTAPAGGDKSPVYTYDADGDRTHDERGEYAYNARDQLVLWDPTGTAAGDAPVSYTMNGSGQIGQEKSSDGTTDYTYAGQRLLERTFTPTSGSAVTYKYRYDDFGNTTRIVGPGAGTTEAPPETPGICSGSANWTSADTSYFCYDEFSRLILSKGADANRHQTALYFFDGLDRRDFRYTYPEGITKPQEWREYSYVGMSQELAREQMDFNQGKDATYDYNSQGKRLGQATRGATGSGIRYYAADAQGSTEALEDSSGGIATDETYLYDPYGALDDHDTSAASDPEDSLSQRAQANPFRFQGSYYDSGTKSYDVQARQYSAEDGRFLSQDVFAAADLDVELQSDPLTQNRYVFAGGNPVSRIDWDGHRPVCDTEAGATVPCDPDGTPPGDNPPPKPPPPPSGEDHPTPGSPGSGSSNDGILDQLAYVLTNAVTPEGPAPKDRRSVPVDPDYLLSSSTDCDADQRIDCNAVPANGSDGILSSGLFEPSPGSDRPDPIKSGEISGSIGPYGCTKSVNTDSNEVVTSDCGWHVPLPIPGEKFEPKSLLQQVFIPSGHAVVYSGEIDSEDDSLGFLVCPGPCLGVDSDRGAAFGAGFDFDINIPDEVPILGGL